MQVPGMQRGANQTSAAIEEGRIESAGAARPQCCQPARAALQCSRPLPACCLCANPIADRQAGLPCCACCAYATPTAA